MTESIECLVRTPPHELVGRIILDGSRLEIGPRVLAEKDGADRTKALKLKSVNCFASLREQGVEPSLLDRCFAAIENRNLVAHGTWMNLLGKGEALIRPHRESPATRDS
jgi:hypothetical protein